MQGDEVLSKGNVGKIIISICLFAAAFLYWYRPWIYFEKPLEPNLILIESLPEDNFQPEQSAAIEFTGDPKTPVKIFIATETMQIEGNIIPVGLDSKGNMATTSEPFGVAWYEHGSSPGWSGNALLAGHNTYIGTPGTFANLYTLVPGDEVRIEYIDGSIGLFIVKSNVTYHINDVPDSVMALDQETRVTLIACAGENVPTLGGFSHRVIVFLDPIEYQSTTEQL